MPRRQYDQLVTTLLDPQLRRLLHQCSKISPEQLAIIAHFNEPILAAASLRAVAKIRAELFDYIMAVVRRHRPDLDDIGVVTVLRELARADGLSVGNNYRGCGGTLVSVALGMWARAWWR